MSDLHDLDDIVNRLDDVVEAIKAQRKEWPWTWISWFIVGFVVFGWVPDLWHSNTRYAIQYDVGYDQITHFYQPTDCSFWRSPLAVC